MTNTLCISSKGYVLKGPLGEPMATWDSKEDWAHVQSQCARRGSYVEVNEPTKAALVTPEMAPLTVKHTNPAKLKPAPKAPSVTTLKKH